MRIRYRVSQFIKAFYTHPTALQLDQARNVLGLALMRLFLQMQPSEQVHSLSIYEQFIADGERDPDLLTAALLHDVGKTRVPLHIWEKVIIVMARRLFLDRVREWGQGQPHGWKRPFVVAEQHAAWGAEMAAAAGASDVAVGIIRRHHQRSFSLPETDQPPEEIMLLQLQTLDEES